MRGLFREEGGVSIVVGALLLIVIFVGAFSTFMVTAVPGMRETKEFEHMREVERSFLKLKHHIEDLKLGESRTVDVKMNPDPAPIFGGPETSGRLAVYENENKYRYGFVLFEIENPDYIDQTWIYEAGAVILAQPVGKNLLSSLPPMVTVIDNYLENIRVDVHTVRIVGTGHSISRSGYVTLEVHIENEFYENRGDHVTKVVLRIFSDYKNAWLDYLGDLKARLDAQTINSVLVKENLELTINGRRTDDVPDIFYFHKITEINIGMW